MKRILTLVLMVLAGLPAFAADLPWLTAGLKAFFDNPRVMSLGWSKDGTVALLAPIDGGGRGGPGARLLLWESVEDKILSDQELWPDEFEDTGDTEPLAKAMAASPAAGEFLDACVDAALVPGTAVIKSFPLVYKGTTFKARAATILRSDRDEFGARIIDYRIVVSSGAGEKTVSAARLEHAITVAVDGYLLSPWEPRALVVSSYTEPGFEGEEPSTFFFSGCLLTSGFKTGG